MKNTKKAFTLVELIVVITILAILATIAFVSLQWYSKNTRNSTRASDITSISNVLDSYQIKTWILPTPTDWTQITYSWSNVFIQWIFWNNTRVQLWNQWNVSKVPKDPLTKKEYIYSILNSKKEYQISWVYETENYMANSTIINSTYANSWERKGILKIKWNYNWVMTKFIKNWTENVIALPSIMVQNTDNNDLVDIINNKELLYNWYKNLPNYYSWTIFNINWDKQLNLVNLDNLILYEWNTDDLRISRTKRWLLLNELQKAYSWTLLENSKRFTNFLNINIWEVQHLSDEADKVILWELNKDIHLKILVWEQIKDYWVNIWVNAQIKNIYVNKKSEWYIVWWFKWKTYIFWKKVNTDNYSIFVAKIDSLWKAKLIKTFDSTNRSYWMSIWVDQDWYIYITWGYKWTINIDWTELTSRWDTYDSFLAKLDTNFDLIWVKEAKTETKIYNRKLLVKDWYIYSALMFDKNATIYWEDLTAVDAADWAIDAYAKDMDSVLFKLDKDWNTIWKKEIHWPWADFLNWLEEKDWYIYVSGSYFSTTNIYWIDLDDKGERDWYIAKLDADWNAIWVKNLWSDKRDWNFALKVDNNWYIYQNWVFRWSSIDIWWITLENSSWKYNSYIAKLDTNWNAIWAKSSWWSSNYATFHIWVDNDWSVYSGWSFYDTISIMWKELTSKWKSDSFMFKLDSDWNLVWLKQIWWEWWEYIAGNKIYNDNNYIFWSTEWNINVLWYQRKIDKRSFILYKITKSWELSYK